METAIVINRPEVYQYQIPTLSRYGVVIEINKIQRAFEAVCLAFNVKQELLKTDHSRKRDYCMCRQAIWKMVKEDDRYINLKSLGAFFGKFDHSTVISGIKAITNAMLTDEALVKKYKIAFDIYQKSETEKLDENYYDYAV